MRAWFPCPFCYVDIEVQAICVHLQEEHCFDLRNAVLLVVCYTMHTLSFVMYVCQFHLSLVDSEVYSIYRFDAYMR